MFSLPGAYFSGENSSSLDRIPLGLQRTYGNYSCETSFLGQISFLSPPSNTVRALRGITQSQCDANKVKEKPCGPHLQTIRGIGRSLCKKTHGEDLIATAVTQISSVKALNSESVFCSKHFLIFLPVTKAKTATKIRCVLSSWNYTFGHSDVHS